MRRASAASNGLEAVEVCRSTPHVADRGAVAGGTVDPVVGVGAGVPHADFIDPDMDEFTLLPNIDGVDETTTEFEFANSTELPAAVAVPSVTALN